MTEPSASPDLATIAYVAARLGIPLSDSMVKAQQMLSGQPQVIHEAADQLSALLNRVAASHQDLRASGGDATNSFSGRTADAFGRRSATVLDDLGQSAAAAQQGVAGLTELGRHVAGQQYGVSAVTAAAVAQIRLLLSQGTGAQ